MSLLVVHDKTFLTQLVFTNLVVNKLALTNEIIQSLDSIQYKKFLFTFGVLNYMPKGQFLSGACLVWFLTVILGLAVFHQGFW